MASNCTYDPREMAGLPIGMFHCPECGEMVVAGIPHPDYDAELPSPSALEMVHHLETCLQESEARAEAADSWAERAAALLRETMNRWPRAVPVWGAADAELWSRCDALLAERETGREGN